MHISKSKEDTHKIAHSLAKSIKGGEVLCLYGDLGAGKTEFAKAVASFFGVDNLLVKSPTYNYIRFYSKNGRKIFHIDLYRIEKLDDLLAQEIEEIFEDKNNLVMIEWAEKMSEILPAKRIDITIEHVDNNSRKIKIDRRAA
jgi:tRNA threonylcarbamoyladenosine biosynthesis protein TsaE